LSFDNAVDAAFALFEVYRKQAAPVFESPTDSQAQLARKQIAGAMARDPIFKAMNKADLQTASDEMWLLVVTNLYLERTMAKLGGETQRQFKENVAGTHERIFGFSIEKLRITKFGYNK
jgi:hypothetical protein